MQHKKFKLLIVAISALIISFGCIAAVENYKEVRHTQSEIKRLETERQQLHEKTQELEKTNSQSKQQIEQQKKTEEELRKEIQDLQAAKAERQRIAALAASQQASAAPSGKTAAGGWHYECRSQAAAVHEATARLLGANATYANYIFDHESCSDPGRLNSGGCAGLGQACPGSKLPCGPNDIDCQVRFFDGHAAGKGGWLASYNFWLANKWW